MFYSKDADVHSDVFRDFLEIQFSAGDFRAGVQKDRIMNCKE